jgi:hypothetical protein
MISRTRTAGAYHDPSAVVPDTRPLDYFPRFYMDPKGTRLSKDSLDAQDLDDPRSILRMGSDAVHAGIAEAISKALSHPDMKTYARYESDDKVSQFSMLAEDKSIRTRTNQEKKRTRLEPLVHPSSSEKERRALLGGELPQFDGRTRDHPKRYVQIGRVRHEPQESSLAAPGKNMDKDLDEILFGPSSRMSVSPSADIAYARLGMSGEFAEPLSHREDLLRIIAKDSLASGFTRDPYMVPKGYYKD